MRVYKFNYSVSGIKTFLPLFYSVKSTNRIRAYIFAKKKLKKKYSPRKVKVYFR